MIDEDGLSSEGQVNFADNFLFIFIPCIVFLQVQEIFSGPDDDVSVGRGLRHELPQ